MPGQSRFRLVLDVIATVAAIVASGAIVWTLATTRQAQPDTRAASRPSVPIPKEPLSLDGATTRGDKQAQVGVVEFSEFQCPFCGQRFEIVVDTSMGTNRFTTDCEVCCRPMEIVAECEPGEILSLDVQAG